MTPPAVADDGALVLDVDLAFGHHLLALADDVEAEEVEALAVSWFEDAGWAGPHALALTAEAVLTGPWLVDGVVRRALRLPAECVQVFLLRCPVLRSGPVGPELTRYDPILAAFADGVPYGIEDEALRFLVAAARRLAGAVRVAGSGAVVTPDPESDVNLTLFSPVWLEPDALVAVLAPALPGVRLAMDLGDFTPSTAGPPTDAPGAEELDEGEQEWLHAEAAAYDEAALADPPVQEGYGAVVELGQDGAIEVAVTGEEHLPVVLTALDWADDGVIAYAVRWWPPDEEALARPEVPLEVRQSRLRAREKVEAAALALYRAAGGEIADDSGFLVEPESLVPGPDDDEA